MNDPQNIFTTGSTEAILKLFVNKIIENDTLSYFTWTGKSTAKYGKKYRFKALENITSLLYDLVAAKDKRYNNDLFESHMIKKVFKYAYS